MAPIGLKKANKWIRDVEKAMEDGRLNDREMILYASQKLSKTASVWWSTYKATHGEPATWEEFKNVFLQSYIVIQPNQTKQKPEKSKPFCWQVERCCKEQCPCQPKKKHRQACTRCGKLGHVARGQEEKCSSCDVSHAIGECTMHAVTCFLCEGSDHVPAKCPLQRAVTAATQLSRVNLLAALVEDQEGEAKTPADKKAKASTKMDSGNALNIPKKIKLSPNDAEARLAATVDSIMKNATCRSSKSSSVGKGKGRGHISLYYGVRFTPSTTECHVLMYREINYIYRARNF
ncbi:unnamed protein product [Alopecurus aequalis]